MRVLDTTTFELSFNGQEYFRSQGYAILSHRWLGAEITFQQIEGYSHELRRASHRMNSPQLDKIRGACMTARQLGLRWMWIDSCCINKESSAELSESINSMFKWYRDAGVCITYLQDVELTSPAQQQADLSIFFKSNSQLPSEWFSRGWTLQELIAPRDMRFFDTNWNYMGTKQSLATEIESITGVSAPYLTGAQDFREACIATKMSWMAGRTTTRQEDIAYGMLGLFGITMTPQYGEGQYAFLRLQHELLSKTTDESLFAWKMPDPNVGAKFVITSSSETTWAPNEWGMLAPTPDWFRSCSNMTIEGGKRITRPAQVFQQVREGVQIPVSKVEGNTTYQVWWNVSSFTVIGALPAYFIIKGLMKKKIMKGVLMPLNCWVRDEKGKLAAVAIFVQPIPGTNLHVKNVSSQRLKRIQASTPFLMYKYAQKKEILGQGVVLQPQLAYVD
ncbi:heterokaryon incompatibility protein-domain-containing protein [Phaeosphaeria sp. MPI-PUGE-AT-0046c]|nr:heterokaryon incompatibility protein-domain-containing protein [Phaeosphaeria sp. MPI-PUGE-AT-0046c]